jgi:voltage-gated potassium channel
MQEQFNKAAYRYLLALTIIVLSIGTIFYHLVENFSWLNSYYFSTVTLATVGYGDFTPHTNAGKIFTTFYIFFGIGIVTTFFSYTVRHRGYKIEQRRNRKKQ